MSPSDDPRKWSGKDASLQETLSRARAGKQFNRYGLYWIPYKNGDAEIIAVDGNKVVGSLYYGKEEPSDDTLKGAVEVRPEYRRQGIATGLYVWAEQLSGLKFRRDEPHTSAASALWNQKRRPFGLDERTHSSGLSRQQRDAIEHVRSQASPPNSPDDVRITTIPYAPVAAYRAPSTVIARVRVADLVATQLSVDREIVVKYIVNGWQEPIRADLRDGKAFISDGHHRAYAASLLGNEWIDAYVDPRLVHAKRDTVVSETTEREPFRDFVERLRREREALRDEVRDEIKRTGAYIKQTSERDERNGYPGGWITITRSTREGVDWQVTFWEGNPNGASAIPSGHLDIVGSIENAIKEVPVGAIKRR